MNINWLKLDVNILNDSKIKIIRKYPDGDALIVLWIGLLCLAMKSDVGGCIYITQGIPYATNDIASEFDISEKTVIMGLQLFQKLGMIDYTESGYLEVVNFNKHQNLDKIEKVREQNRVRQIEYRKKNNANMSRVTNINVTAQTRLDQTRLEEIRQDKNKEDNKEPRKREQQKFVKPSIFELDEFMQSIGIMDKEIPEKFYHYYESKGWLIGKSPMKSWRDACYTWKKKQNEYLKSKPAYDDAARTKELESWLGGNK